MKNLLPLLLICLLWACTEAPKDPRTQASNSQTATPGQEIQTTDANGLNVSGTEGEVTPQQVLDALAKMDQSTVKVSGTAGGVRIETDGTNTKTIPQQKLNLSGSGMKRSATCNGEHVIVDGVGNIITLSGRAGLLEVKGSNQIIYVESADQIDVSGDNNAVYWATEVNGNEPKVTQKGSSNLVNKGSKPA